jgi:hypothetical protein
VATTLSDAAVGTSDVSVVARFSAIMEWWTINETGRLVDLGRTVLQLSSLAPNDRPVMLRPYTWQ